MKSLPTASNQILRKTLGMGIICGLELLIGEDCTLKITKGYGITSAGLFLQFPNRHFKYAKPYEGTIKGFEIEQEDLEIWELFEQKKEECTHLTPQTIGTPPFAEDKVILLYIEDIETSIVKPLMVNKEDAWSIIGKLQKLDLECLDLDGVEADDIPLFPQEEEFPSGQRLYCVINRNTSLKPIYLMRFGFATIEDECNPEDFEFSLESADLAGLNKEYEAIILNGIGQLQNNLNTLHTAAFNDLIPKQQQFYLDLYLKYLAGNRWEAFIDSEKSLYLQIFYAFIKDLVRTYNELLKEVVQLVADCCPNERLFPYHLLLGEVQADISFGHSVFRNHFRQPAIYNNNQIRFQKIRFLHWRMVMQIKNFYIPSIEYSDYGEGHYTQIEKNDTGPSPLEAALVNSIKVTPIKNLDTPLGKQPIPIYYYVGNDPNSIHHFWDFETVYGCNKQYLYSYHADTEDSYTDICAIKRPLGYQKDRFDFLKIEGVIGQLVNLTSAETIANFKTTLITLQKRFNLNFQIEIASISEILEDADGDNDFQLKEEYIGIEYISGVKKGDRLLLIHDKDGYIISNFWMPCCEINGLEAIAEIIKEPAEGEPVAPAPKIPEAPAEATSSGRARVFNYCASDETLKAIHVKIGDKIFQTNEEGIFEYEISSGNHKIELEDDIPFYLKQKEITIEGVNPDLIKLEAFPINTLTIQLAPQVGNDFFDNREPIELRIGKKIVDSVRPNRKGKITFTSLGDLEGMEVFRKEKRLSIVDFNPCQENKVLDIEIDERQFPPQQPEWYSGKEGIIPNADVNETIRKVESLWKPRTKETLSLLDELEKGKQVEIENLIYPYIFDNNLSAEELSNTYDSYVEYTKLNLDFFKSANGQTLSKAITEMYLERTGIITNEVTDAINNNVGKAIEGGLLQRDSLATFITDWQGKAGTFVKDDFVNGLKEETIIIGIRRQTELNQDKIFGLGGASKDWLKKKGITTMDALAATPPDKLKAIMLEAESAGLRRLDVSTWSEQAKLFIEDPLAHTERFNQLRENRRNRPN